MVECPICSKECANEFGLKGHLKSHKDEMSEEELQNIINSIGESEKTESVEKSKKIKVTMISDPRRAEEKVRFVACNEIKYYIPYNVEVEVEPEIADVVKEYNKMIKNLDLKKDEILKGTLKRL